MVPWVGPDALGARLVEQASGSLWPRSRRLDAARAIRKSAPRPRVARTRTAEEEPRPAVAPQQARAATASAAAPAPVATLAPMAPWVPVAAQAQGARTA